MKKGAQQKVIKLLTSQGYVTNWYCIDQRITTRLSSIIERLRKRGWVINTEIKENKDCIYRLQYRSNDVKLTYGAFSEPRLDIVPTPKQLGLKL